MACRSPDGWGRWSCTLLFLCMSMGMLFGLAAPAQAEGVKLIVRAGAGSFYKSGLAFSAFVTVTNDGPAVSGVLEGEGSDHYGYGGTPHTELPVHLPTGSKKSFQLIFPQGAELWQRGKEIAIHLKDERGKVLASASAISKPVDPGDTLFLVVSKDRSGFDYLEGLRKFLYGKMPPYQTPGIHVSYAVPDALPAHWAALTSFDYVIWSHPGQVPLGEAKQRALLEWLVNGGKLVIMTGLDPNELTQSLLAPLLPGRPTAIDLLAAPSGQAVKASPSDAAQFQAPETVSVLRLPAVKGQVLRRYGSTPLLLAIPCGRGQIFLSTVDMASPTVLTDAALKGWWRAIARAGRANSQRDLGAIIDGSGGNLLQWPPEVTPPSVGFLALFLMIYVVVVGPVNFLLLRRFDRMLWMYVTVPGLAILFTLVTFGIGLSSKGIRTVVRQVSVVDVVEEAPAAWVRTCWSVFASSSRAYDMRLPGHSTLIGEVSDRGSRPAVRIDAEGLELCSIDLQMWSLRRFLGDTVVGLPGTVRMRLVLGPSGFGGEIDNRSGLVLGPCVLYQKERVSVPFDLKRGLNPIRVSLARPRAVPLNGLGLVLKDLIPAPATDETDMKEANEELLDKTARCLGTAPRPYLIGWSQQPLTPVAVNDPRVRTMVRTLVVVHRP